MRLDKNKMMISKDDVQLRAQVHFCYMYLQSGIKMVQIFGRTCHMEDRLESHPEVSHLERVVLLDALREHAHSLPIVLIEKTVVVDVQRRTL